MIARARPRHALRYSLGVLLAFIVYGCYDFFYGLTIIDAKIVTIIDDDKKPDLKYLSVVLLSDFPPYPFVSDKVRSFFRHDPTLCFIKPDGSELMNDDAFTPCFREENQGSKWAKMHHMEKSEFLIPFYQVATEPIGNREFYKTMVRDKSLWAKFQLTGFFIPPTVESKPLFLSLEPYCKTHQAHCKAIFGWQDGAANLPAK